MISKWGDCVENRILPNRIQKHLKDMRAVKDTIGCSNASIYHYKKDDVELYLKIEKTNVEFEHEQIIMQWLQNKLPVPQIIAQAKGAGYDYLLMTKAVGEMSCSDYFLKKPEELVGLLAKGIEMLQAVNISGCPYECKLEMKLNKAKKRINLGLIDTSDWEADTPFKTPEELYDYLVNHRHSEELVFSHGDYCLPNIFLSDNEVTGFIDLGRAGIGDKWQDIALCVRSIRHNLKEDRYVDMFFQHLKIQPNHEKIRYYILLDELF